MFRTPSASHRLATLCVLLVPATIVGAVAHPGVAALPLALLASAVVVIQPTPPQLRSVEWLMNTAAAANLDSRPATRVALRH